MVLHSKTCSKEMAGLGSLSSKQKTGFSLSSESKKNIIQNWQYTSVCMQLEHARSSGENTWKSQMQKTDTEQNGATELQVPLDQQGSNC